MNVTFNIPDDVLHLARSLALSDGRSLSNYVIQLLRVATRRAQADGIVAPMPPVPTAKPTLKPLTDPDFDDPNWDGDDVE